MNIDAVKKNVRIRCADCRHHKSKRTVSGTFEKFLQKDVNLVQLFPDFRAVLHLDAEILSDFCELVVDDGKDFSASNGRSLDR